MSPHLRGAVLWLSLAACSTPSPRGPDPVIAEGGGITLTASGLQAQLRGQPPVVRHGFRTPEGKRRFLEEALRFELLAQEARRTGLGEDPEVQLALKQALAAAHYRRFEQEQAAKEVPEADLRRWYDGHPEEFTRPARARPAVVLLAAPEGSPARAEAGAAARRLLAEVLGKESANPRALQELAAARSDDAASRPLGGELGLLTREELEAHDPLLAEAAMALEANRTWPRVIETPRGFYLLRVLERQPEQRRPFEEARGSIALRLARERRETDYRALGDQLRARATLRIDEPALDRLAAPMVPGAGG